MDNFTITYIQSDLIWEDSSANLKNFEKYLSQIEKTDLLVLPEMFNTGFSMQVKALAQPPQGEVVNWLRRKANEHNFAIMGSAIITDNGKYFNRLMIAYPTGELKHYDKRHLFRMGKEHENFDAGMRMEIFDLMDWRIRPLICYDLRFPVWSRNQNNYDLLIYVANWPAARHEVWKTLLKARAIENQCYVLGVNRIGSDGMDIEYSGDSMLIDARGNVISSIPANEEGMATVSISLNALQQFRDKFPVHLDADDFRIV